MILADFSGICSLLFCEGISAGLGIATGHDMQDKAPMKTVALIGDSAMSAGMPFEALSNAGDLNKNLLEHGSFHNYI